MAPGDRFRYEQIERAAEKLLNDCQRTHPFRSAPPPIPVEYIAEHFLDLTFLWESIPEPPGRTVLAKLVPSDHRIIFNEIHTDLYETTPYLYNTVLAHEVGHWELHVERDTLVQTMPMFRDGPSEYVVYSAGDGKQFSSWDEKNANRFMACLLMPRDLICAAVAERPLRGFPDLYALREQFEVTITALSIRLERLDLLYIDSDRNFHPSRAAFHGQKALWQEPFLP